MQMLKFGYPSGLVPVLKSNLMLYSAAKWYSSSHCNGSEGFLSDSYRCRRTRERDFDDSIVVGGDCLNHKNQLLPRSYATSSTLRMRASCSCVKIGSSCCFFFFAQEFVRISPEPLAKIISSLTTNNNDNN